MKKMLSYTGHGLCLLLLLSGHAIGQVTISGPTCVVAGTVYQYVISGVSDSSSSLQVCVNGGLLTDPSASSLCTAARSSFARVLVIFSDSATAIGSLFLTSGSW